MRPRTSPHQPASSSTAYPCGARSVRLLPGAGMDNELNLTRARLGDEPIDGFPPAAVLTALLIAALWDDPDLELVSRPAWADNLLLASVHDLRTVGVALVAEIHSRTTRALGVDSPSLVGALDGALNATGESLLPSGTASI